MRDNRLLEVFAQYKAEAEACPSVSSNIHCNNGCQWFTPATNPRIEFNNDPNYVFGHLVNRMTMARGPLARNSSVINKYGIVNTLGKYNTTAILNQSQSNSCNREIAVDMIYSTS